MQDKRRHTRYTLKVMEVEGKIMFASEVKIIDISIGGISLKANRRLNIGSEYLLKLNDKKKAISLKSTVVWSSLNESRKSPSGELIPIYTVGLKFNNISVEKITELLEFIEGHKKEEVSVTEGQRLNVRFHVNDPGKAILNFPARYKVKTISLGGMLIECVRDFEVDSRIPMELSLHDDKPIKFVGRVASCKVIDSGGQKQYDIGIEFLDLTDKDREVLTTFVEYCNIMETGNEADTTANKTVATLIDPKLRKEYDTRPVPGVRPEMETAKVVVRYADGKLIKGYTHDFLPTRPSFHVRPIEFEPTDKGVEVSVKELKAVFFVKDFTGNRAYYERKEFTAGQQLSGRKVEVTFADGEVIVGSVLGYDPRRLGFFVTPADPQSNNLRVFVISTAVSKFRYL
jgi:Tfp pilus assembly protein PilZ